VFDAAKLVLLADLLTKHASAAKTASPALPLAAAAAGGAAAGAAASGVCSTATTLLGKYFSANALQVISTAASAALKSRKVANQVTGARFLAETVACDASMLLLLPPGTAVESKAEAAMFAEFAGTHAAVLTSAAGAAGAGAGAGADAGYHLPNMKCATMEIVDKAKALAALSLLNQSASLSGTGAATAAGSGGLKGLLRVFLKAAETKVINILQTQLSGKSNASESSDGVAGMLTMVRVLQQILVDVYLLFLCPVGSSAVFPGGVAPGTTDCIGLIPMFQRQLFEQSVAQVQHYCNAASATMATAGSKSSSKVSPLSFDIQGAMNSVTYAFSGATSTVSAGAYNRELSKIFKGWFSQVLNAVSSQCKAVLSGLTSAAEVAQLQQKVWACCVNITAQTSKSDAASPGPLASNTSNRRPGSLEGNDAAGTKHIGEGALSSSGSNGKTHVAGANALLLDPAALDLLFGTLYCYTQSHWEAASAALLSLTSDISTSGVAAGAGAGAGGKRDSSKAATYLWSNVFRGCFLHQVERLLQSSCEDVLYDTKVDLLRTLKRHGVVVSFDSLVAKTVVSATTSVADSGTAALTATGKDLLSRFQQCNFSDYAADVSHLSSPKIYAAAEKIRQRFEQNLTALLADVVEPVRFPFYEPYIRRIIVVPFTYNNSALITLKKKKLLLFVRHKTLSYLVGVLRSREVILRLLALLLCPCVHSVHN
jgi:hypothetical protein